MKLSISKRLVIGFATLCIFLLGLGIFAITTMNNNKVTTQAIINNWLPSLSKAYQLKLSMIVFQKLEQDYVKASGTAEDQSIEIKMNELNDILIKNKDQYLEKSISEQGKQVALAISTDFEAYQLHTTPL